MAKDKIRLLLTITPDKMPEWYACLQSIDSGFVRAEVVRRALKKIRPGHIQLMSVPNPANDHPKPARETADEPDESSTQMPESATRTISTQVDKLTDVDDQPVDAASMTPRYPVSNPADSTRPTSKESMAAKIIQHGTGRSWT